MISSHPVVPEEILYHSDRRCVRRRQLGGRLDGQLDGNRNSVVVHEFLGVDAMARLHHEVRILERLKGVEGVLQLIAVDRRCNAITLEDLHGTSLAQVLQTERIKVRSQVPLMLALAKTVAAVHRHGIVHKDINPSHIMLSEGDRKPTLLHFDSATTAAELHGTFVQPRGMGGTLAYLAPELTGRTARSIDHRADLYALGIVFYEMSTGRVPFADTDPLRLMHDILARAPAPPISCDRTVPEPLSDIIMRLLEKEPDQRYQSADGLVHDLSRLHAALQQGESTPFQLGENDFALRLLAPSRLIGRETEINALREALEASLHASCTGVLIGGAQGVGKSVLLNELRSIVTAQRGWFVMGKFDEHRRDLASDAIHQALRALGRLLLAEPEAELVALRANIRRTLDTRASEVAETLPEFALLLGMDPRPAAGKPLENTKQATQTTVQLVRAIASPARPIVMVLDDLQWATPAPIRIVDAALRDGSLHGLLLVGAFREADTKTTEPLASMLPRWEQLNPRPLRLQLKNLPPAKLTLLLKEMLRMPQEQAAVLAQNLGERTGGNPYDTVELINALRHEGLLAHGANGWNWDPAQIRRYVGRSEVVELLAARMMRLPQQARALLELMACLSGELEPAVLEAASGLSATEWADHIAPCLEDGLLVPDSDSNGAIGFRHDRVRQVAYDRMTPSARQHLHLTLARRLIQHPRFEALAAEQYLAVIGAIDDPRERHTVVALLRRAASNARRVDVAVAERFLSAALLILRPMADAADASLLLTLEVERHAMLQNLGRLDEADVVYGSIERQCRDPVELSGPGCVQLVSLTIRGRHGKALTLGFELLARLGFERPAADIAAELDQRLDALYAWLADLDHAADLQRAPLTDPRLIAASEVRVRMLQPAFCSNPTLAFWLVLESHRHWVEYGPCAQLTSGLTALPVALGALRDDYRMGYALMRKMTAASASCADGYEMRRWHFSALFVDHWVESLAADLEKCDRIRRIFLKVGDPQQACIVHYVSFAALFECAPTLDACAADLDAGLALASRSGDQHSDAVFTAFGQLLLDLRGDSNDSAGVGEPEFDEDRYLLGLGANPMAAAFFHITRALAAVLFAGTSQDHTDLVRYAAAGIRMTQYINGHFYVGLAHFVQAFALAAHARTASSEDRANAIAELAECRNWLARRAEDAPDNFLTLLLLVDAERAWAAGDLQKSMVAFDVALRQAQRRERPWHLALITERAAELHLACGLEYTGRKLLREARRGYEEWGAAEKVRELDQVHAFLRTDDNESAAGVERERGAVSSDTIDMLAILRTSQALSSETALDKLKERVVELLGAMTGATRVLFIMHSDDPSGWFLPAADESSEIISVDEAGVRGLLPLSAFRYAERTREPLLLEDATRDDRFARDAYIASLERCSLLIAPIFSHGLPRAVLLLENRSGRGAFSADRLDAVMLIAGQLGVSLDNARRFELLERNVAERTAELANSLAELRTVHGQLLEASRQGGMAEVATNVLHNVGNVLTSVNVSATVVAESLQKSKASGLARVVGLLREHEHDLGTFISSDPRGKHLPQYLAQLAEHLQADRQASIQELNLLRSNIEHIREIVTMQQTYAKVSAIKELVHVSDLVEDSLRLNLGALSRHGIELVREFQDLPPMQLEKHMVIQVLVNLISNAKYACDESLKNDKRLTLRIGTNGGTGRVFISVSDNGVGIPQENLTRIFNHGFTTRAAGHGFGLHSSALAAKEIGGALTVHSDGVGTGATFTLEIPIEVTSVVP